jgi:two-component system chemotaxis response regulator CheB
MTMAAGESIEMIVMGVSAGGLHVMTKLLEDLPPAFPVPIVVVQHRSKDQRTLLEEVLQAKCQIKIRQANEKERPKAGSVYFAPADYHLLLEEDGCFSLSCDQAVNYSRPSIDILFETAADTFGSNVLAILLTGANSDGAKGMLKVKQKGGMTIAQRPASAEFSTMPQAAITANAAKQVKDINEIKLLLLGLAKNK